jgi:ABC-type uncharacterized transport system permease subunit
MHPTLLPILTVVAYFLAFGLMLASLRAATPGASKTCNVCRTASLFMGWLAVATHLASVGTELIRDQGPNFSFLAALSLVSLLIAALILITAWIKPVEKLGIIAFPLAGFVMTLKIFLDNEVHRVSNHSFEMQTHILSSLLAYSFLNIAALQAILLAAQDFCLKHHQRAGLLLRSLPSLQSMESLLFQLIGAGIVFLTASLITGFAFMEDMFAQHLAHKTILSILAWIVFMTLLIGRIRNGWRGQTAIRWTLAGFASLMLAYFGTKMVLEIILNRV